ncbi:MAG: hypothetical protein GY785_14445 [Gammaproteobacteria bacterium]|nr:hypothetical protein [Gammaproteobacteria bacterium]
MTKWSITQAGEHDPCHKKFNIIILGAMEETARSRGEVYKGKARFVGSNAIEVDGVRLEADNIVIATGSITRPLSIPGAEHLITSDEVLSVGMSEAEAVAAGLEFDAIISDMSGWFSATGL